MSDTGPKINRSGVCSIRFNRLWGEFDIDSDRTYNVHVVELENLAAVLNQIDEIGNAFSKREAIKPIVDELRSKYAAN